MDWSVGYVRRVEGTLPRRETRPVHEPKVGTTTHRGNSDAFVVEQADASVVAPGGHNPLLHTDAPPDGLASSGRYIYIIS